MPCWAAAPEGKTAMKKLLASLALAALLLPVGAAFAQEAPPPAPPADTTAAAAPEPTKKTLWQEWIVPLGWCGYPLALCSIGVVTMVILNIRMVTRKNLMPIGVVIPLRTAAEQRDVGQMYSLCRATPNLFTKGLMPGLRKINPEDPAASKSDMESSIAEAVGREEAQVSFWINFLSLFASISPMIGLLGTVSGMIGAFGQIGAGGMGRPEQLAENIKEALFTTAAGLMIAVPAIFAFFIFRNNLSRIIRDAEAFYSELIDALTGTANLFAETDKEVAPVENES